MSFFSEPRNFGMAALVAGILTAISAVASAVTNALSDEIYWAIIVGAVGSVIYGLMFAAMGKKVRDGEISSRIEILGRLILIVAIGFIIKSIFSAIGLAIDGSVGSAVATLVIGIIFWLIIKWIAGHVLDGQSTTMDKFIWILLVIVFIILSLVSILSVFTSLAGGPVDIIIGFIAAICNVIMYVFMLLNLFTDEVKSEMGIY